MVEEILKSLAGEPKILDQRYSVNKEFWKEKSHHFISTMEIEERSFSRSSMLFHSWGSRWLQKWNMEKLWEDEILYWKYRNCQNLGPFDKNPNAPNKNTDTQILCAAINGYTGIVEILAPLTDDPNAPHCYIV